MSISGPKLCHLPDGRFYVTIPGSGRKRKYFKERGSDPLNPPESVRNEYIVFLAELTGKVVQAETIPDGITVSEVLAKYVAWAAENYPTPQTAEDIRVYTKSLVEAYGRTEAAKFGGAKLIAIRDAEVAKGKRSRQGINRMVRIIQRAFGWAVGRELIPPTIAATLERVEMLGRGRTNAPEHRPTQPISLEVMEQTLAYCSPVVADMARLQRFTGMRPGEVCSLSLEELDRTDSTCWVYSPASHKCAWRGKKRVVGIGPRGISVLAKYLRADGLPLFNPGEAEQKRREMLREERQTPLWPSSINRPKKEIPKRAPGNSYTAKSYARAIARACYLANIPRWSPYSLRKAACDEIRNRFDLPTAAAVLGHSDPKTTEQFYASRDLSRIKEAARVVG